MTITKERLLKIQHWRETYGADSNVMLPAEEAAELARIALASLDAEPVGEVSDKRHGLVMDGTVDLGGKSTYRIIKGEKAMKRLPLGTKFYIAPPAPVVPDGLRQALSNAGIAAPESDEMLAATCEKYIQMLVTWVKDRKPFQPAPVMPAELHPDTQNLAANFCTALAEKLYGAQLKYGYDADWKQDGWATQCLSHFHQHIAKGDPRDVAAYCAFMWYHGWKTESVSGPVVPDDQADAFIAAIEKEQDRLHEEDYLMDSKDCIDVIREEVQRLNACRAALLQSEYRDLSQPVDPQISEYEKIMLRAGWVMVPVEPTSEMINAALKSHLIVFNPVETYSVMLAAAPQPEANNE